MEDNVSEEVLKTRKIYTKDELLALKDVGLSRIWPKILDKTCINDYGQWDPVKSFDNANKTIEPIKKPNFYEGRTFRPSDKSKDDISLRPELRKWNDGCQVSNMNKRDDHHGGFKKPYQNSTPNCGSGDFDRRYQRTNAGRGRGRTNREDSSKLSIHPKATLDRFNNRNNSANASDENKRNSVDDTDNYDPSKVVTTINNNNSNNYRSSYPNHHTNRFHRNSEPEWFLDGPDNCNETIELHGINSNDTTMVPFKMMSEENESKKNVEIEEKDDVTKDITETAIQLDPLNAILKFSNTPTKIITKQPNSTNTKRGGSRFQDIFQKEARNNETKEMESFLKACLSTDADNKKNIFESDQLNVSKPLPTNGQVIFVEELEKNMGGAESTRSSQLNTETIRTSDKYISDPIAKFMGLSNANTGASMNGHLGIQSSNPLDLHHHQNLQSATNYTSSNINQHNIPITTNTNSSLLLNTSSTSDTNKVVNWLSGLQEDSISGFNISTSSPNLQIASSPNLQIASTNSGYLHQPLKMQHDSTTAISGNTSTNSLYNTGNILRNAPAIPPPGLPLMVNSQTSMMQHQKMMQIQKQQQQQQQQQQINMMKNLPYNQINSPFMGTMKQSNNKNYPQYFMSIPNNSLQDMNPSTNSKMDPITNMVMKSQQQQILQQRANLLTQQHQNSHLNGPPGLTINSSNMDMQRAGNIFPSPPASNMAGTARPIVKTSQPTNSSQLVDMSRLADINRNYQNNLNAQRTGGMAGNFPAPHITNNHSAHVLGLMGSSNYGQSTHQAADLIKTLRMPNNIHQQLSSTSSHNATPILGNGNSPWNVSNAKSNIFHSSNTQNHYFPTHNHTIQQNHPNNTRVLDNLFDIGTSTLPPLPAEAKYANQLETENF